MAKAFWTWFFIEIKRGVSFLPRLLAGAFLLAILLIGISMATSYSLIQQGKQKEKAQVALFLPEDDRAVIWMMSVLEEMDSVKDSIAFHRTQTEEEAVLQLQRGEAAGAVIIPEKFVQGIVNGTNTPARIILPKGAPLTSKVVKELTSAGADTLGAAQAGIYSVLEYYRKTGREEKVPKVVRELNQIYLDYVFPRNDMFIHRKLSLTGSLTTAAYLEAAGIVFFIFLWGMGVANLFSERRAYWDRLRIYGITVGHLVGMRIFVIFLLLLCTGLLFGIPAALLFKTPFLKGSVLLPGVLCLWIAASYIMFIYAIGKDGFSGAMLLFITTIVMLFCAGGFIPAVFLPESVQKISFFLPPSICIRLLSAGVSGTMPVGLFFQAMLLSGALYGVAVAAIARRRRVVDR